MSKGSRELLGTFSLITISEQPFVNLLSSSFLFVFFAAPPFFVTYFFGARHINGAQFREENTRICTNCTVFLIIFKNN